MLLTLVGDELPEEITVQKSEVPNTKTYTENPPTPLTEAEKQPQTVPVEEGGIYRFTLKAGQKLTVKDLPAGIASIIKPSVATAPHSSPTIMVIV